MNTRLKKALKITAISLSGLVISILCVIALVVNVIFTPKKITPIVVKTANEFLEANIEIEAVDLTFFSTFPRFGLKIAEGSITKPMDSIAQSCDSLLQFSECVVIINPMAYLLHNEIRIKQLTLDKASIYAYVNESGNTNWDIVTLGTETETDTTTSAFDSAIQIERLGISNANLIFDDRTTELYAQVSNMNVELAGLLSQAESALKLSFTTDNNLVWQQGNLLINKLALGADATLMVNRETNIVNVHEAAIDINGLKIGAKGNFLLDSVEQRIGMDVEMGLLVPDMGTILALIPSSIINETAQVETTGEVVLKATLKGYYGQKQFPQIEGFAYIKEGSASYKGLPYSLEKLNFKADYFLDLMERRASYINISQLEVKAASTELKMNVKANNILKDPTLSSSIKGKINFTELAKTFPILPDVVMEGLIDVNLNSNFALNDLQQMNLSKVDATGVVQIKNMALISPKDTFELKIANAAVALGTNASSATTKGKKELLSGIAGFDGLKIHQRNRLMGQLNSISIDFQATPAKDTTTVGNLYANFKFSGLAAVSGDSINLQTGAGGAKVELMPYRKNKLQTAIQTDIYIDSVSVRFGDMVALLDLAGINATLEPLKNNRWHTTGALGFKEMQAFTPAFPLLTTLSNTKIEFTPDYISLNNTRLDIGSSNLRLSGKIYDIQSAIIEQKELKAVLKLASTQINCNELMQASVIGSEYKAQKSTTRYKQTDADAAIELPKNMASQNTMPNLATNQAKVFVVPSNIDFLFDTQIDQIRFGELEMENFKGKVQLKDQIVSMQDIGFEALGANMKTTVIYSAKDTTSAYAGFDLSIVDVNIAKIINIIPSMNEMLPMLQSFEGEVDFHVAGETKLNEQMAIVLPSLKGAVALQGQNLVLLDGETFGEIAKMLRFKQKDKNLIDSIAVDILITDGAIEVFPFVIKLDKYMAAIGGEHHLDMTYNYHISALEPIRIGVNVTGTPNKMKFGIGAAKYKDMFVATKRRNIDSTAFVVRDKVRASLINK